MKLGAIIVGERDFELWHSCKYGNTLSFKFLGKENKEITIETCVVIRFKEIKILWIKTGWIILRLKFKEPGTRNCFYNGMWEGLYNINSKSGFMNKKSNPYFLK